MFGFVHELGRVVTIAHAAQQPIHYQLDQDGREELLASPVMMRYAANTIVSTVRGIELRHRRGASYDMLVGQMSSNLWKHNGSVYGHIVCRDDSESRAITRADASDFREPRKITSDEPLFNYMGNLLLVAVARQQDRSRLLGQLMPDPFA
jgi:hypothetical protein